MDGADGARGLGIGDAKIAAAGGAVDGHLRNDGNTHAGGNHAEQARKLAALENDARVKAGAIAGGNGGVAKAVSITKEQEGLGAKIFEGDGVAFGEFMFGRNGGEETFGEERKSFEFVAADGKSEDGDIDGAGAESIEKDGRDFFDDGNLRLRKFAGEGRELCGEKIRRDGGDDAESEAAAYGIFLFVDVTFGGFEFAKDGASAR
jgi:hypothetical protein